MSIRLPKPKTWFWLFVIALVALFLWSSIERVTAVAAVQDSLERAWEIDFNAGGCPASLPAPIDDRLYNFLVDRLPDKEGDVLERYLNRNVIWHERLRALFRGPMRSIRIYEPDAFRGDLGGALARFPELERISVDGSVGENYPTEVDWTLLCTRLRSLTQLKEIELGGTWVTDAAIAPLAGHPRLRTISINIGRLTVDSVRTFRAIPRLTKLHIEGLSGDAKTALSAENQKAMSAALPKVTIEFP